MTTLTLTCVANPREHYDIRETGQAMARPGRKRKAGLRTPSGRLSRATGAQSEHHEAIATRIRLFGLTEADARDQKAGTFVGRLQLMRLISQAQYDAAQDFLAIYEHYQRALKSPDALRSPSNKGEAPESEGYADWCRRAIAHYDAAMKAVAETQNLHVNRGSNLYAALDYVVCRDMQLWHLVGDARLALNALAHHFAGKRVRAA